MTYIPNDRDSGFVIDNIPDTDALAEGAANFYYTEGRFNVSFMSKNTDDLSEGTTNLYYTTARFNTDFTTAISGISTDDISEGATNLYYTDARVSTFLDTQKGVAGGIAELDGSGLVPVSQLPDAVLGGPRFQGVWDAATNTPDLSALTPAQGDYYRVSVAGTTLLDGNNDWGVGDWAIFNGTAWDKIDNSETAGVTTFTALTDTPPNFTGAGGQILRVNAGETAVEYVGFDTLFDTEFATKTTDDLTEGATNLYFTDARAQAAARGKPTSIVDSVATFTVTTEELVLAEPGTFGSDITVNLPAASTYIDSGRHTCITIKNDTNTNDRVTIDPNGAEVIDGSSTIDLKKREAVTLAPKTGGWSII